MFDGEKYAEQGIFNELDDREEHRFRFRQSLQRSEPGGILNQSREIGTAPRARASRAPCCCLENCFSIDSCPVNVYDGGRMAKKVKIPPSVAEQALIRLMRVGDRVWRA